MFEIILGSIVVVFCKHGFKHSNSEIASEQSHLSEDGGFKHQIFIE